MADKEGAATGLLIAWSDGRREAVENFVPLVYEDLRRMAAGYIAARTARSRTTANGTRSRSVRAADRSAAREVALPRPFHFFRGSSAGLTYVIDHGPTP